MSGAYPQDLNLHCIGEAWQLLSVQVVSFGGVCVHTSPLPEAEKLYNA